MRQHACWNFLLQVIAASAHVRRRRGLETSKTNTDNRKENKTKAKSEQHGTAIMAYRKHIPTTMHNTASTIGGIDGTARVSNCIGTFKLHNTPHNTRNTV